MPTLDQTVSSWPLIQASWTTPASDTLWQSFYAENEVPVQPDNDSQANNLTRGSSDILRYFYILSPDTATEPRYAQLDIIKSGKNNTLYWSVNVVTTPDNNPPDSIKRLDKHIGGMAGFAGIVKQIISEFSPIVFFDVKYSITSKNRTCPLLEQITEPLNQKTGRLAGRLRPDHISYKISDGHDGLESISIGYNEEKERFWFTFSIKSALTELGSVWFPFINDICREIQSLLFVSCKENSYEDV